MKKFLRLEPVLTIIEVVIQIAHVEVIRLAIPLRIVLTVTQITKFNSGN